MKREPIIAFPWQHLTCYTIDSYIYDNNNERGMYCCVFMANAPQSNVVLHCISCFHFSLPLPFLVLLLVYLPVFWCAVCDSILWPKLCVGPRHCRHYLCRIMNRSMLPLGAWRPSQIISKPFGRKKDGRYHCLRLTSAKLRSFLSLL